MTMMHHLAASILLSVGVAFAGVAPQAPGQPPAAVELVATFIGNEGWSITDGKDVVVTDFPYESGYSRYMTWAPDHVPKAPAGARTVVLITHTHRDHFAAELIGKIPGRLVALFGPKDARSAAGAAGDVSPSPLPIPGLEVRPIETPHAGREHYSYVFEWHGVRFYLPGDTETPESLLAQKDLDVAFVTPWMLRAVERREGRIDARRLIVVHHEAGEDVRPYQGSRVPRQGEILRVRADDRSRF
jgi:L-ascorbate metabolism protein UlaG (beta-lactamase superfamily)